MKYLIKRAQKHDDQAFVELIELVKQDMYKTARSYLHKQEDIADAIQETIITCYENIGRLKEPKYFKTWLIRILINKCNDILRAGKREYLSNTVPEQEGTCMALQNYEFEELMKQMDDKYRIVLLLYYSEGFKIREIAQILELEESTVKTRLVRGRRQFEKVYGLEVAVQRR
ncbi:sigma-70 family RNA polymerase sigma factor [Eubacterium sp. am_0171]|uniref:RNA polymerase sigma factor sigV n=1 Tax=Faecalicatena contorta TaxID=39482 RepID=A0A174JU06_9FIRM|nr:MULTISPECIES: sigma-70 family RNA polymerase sigma factor [Clostridia]MSC85095.1 sigma-70 family RNA polymerase sigma factor [Eubacterium sp. BIOML-A1]MSD05552.1 sigma-70 family RNA polymerase sigma factor [Eubacterium sp. BIOML-A2]RYT24628.1 sigma-70 family RNA polymerase sigma factor [Eubacterium sp. am_0171]CUP03263.1 RNA polymerase sigma factor sigV [[Eubacterium] contortum] [Faecalicatena contorta]